MENKYLLTQIQDYMTTQDEENSKERHAKDSFWASQTETCSFDLYHQWLGTAPTNPVDAEKLMVFSAGKMMELSLVQTLDRMGLLQKPQTDQFRVEMEREGVKVTGYIDGVFTDGTVLECKSMYGDYQLNDLRAGKPRPSYLKQLAIYMDFLNQNTGKLVYMDRGTGEMFEFTLLRTPDTLKFKCMLVEFDLADTYKRWAKLYNENILPKKEPICEIKYKYDLQTLDWSKVSKSDISKARNGYKVIGDWQALYSPYKDLIIKQEGTQLGYSQAELEIIKAATKGYSTK